MRTSVGILVNTLCQVGDVTRAGALAMSVATDEDKASTASDTGACEEPLFQLAQCLQNRIVRNENRGLRRLGKSNDSRLINHKPRTLRTYIPPYRRRVLDQLGVVEENVIRLRHLTSCIAQQWVGEAHCLRSCFI